MLHQKSFIFLLKNDKDKNAKVDSNLDNNVSDFPLSERARYFLR